MKENLKNYIMRGSKRAVLFALGGNTMIAIIKLIASFFTRSSAMMAESIHSFADCFNQIFPLIGAKQASKPKDEQHPFGYGREEYFYGFLVAVFLFFVGALFSIYEGVHKILNPEPIHYVWLSLSIFGVSMIIEAKSFFVAYKEFTKTHKGNFLKGIEKCTDTNILVILLEDAAALLGLFLAFICTILAILVHPIFDAIGSILIGLLLVYVSYTLINELRKSIIGESMPREDRNGIKDIVNEYHIIKHINKIQTMAIGRNYLLLLSVDFEDDTNGYNIEDMVEDIKVNIRKEFPNVDEIYIEGRDMNRNGRS